MRTAVNHRGEDQKARKDSKRKVMRWLSIIIGSYLLIGVVYSIAIPIGETPDESEHFLYLQHIVFHRSLPIMSHVYEENETLEAHQPPLYYLIGASLTGWTDMEAADNLVENSCFSFEPGDAGRKNAFLHRQEEWPPRRGVFLSFQLMRWISLILGAGTVLLAYIIGRQILPADQRLALFGAATLAFNPQFIFVTASVNNDVLTTFLGAAIVALCVRAVERPQQRAFLVLGILVGAGILTKFSLLSFWPLVMLAVLLASVRLRRSVEQTGRQPDDDKRFLPALDSDARTFRLRSLRVTIDFCRLVVTGLTVVLLPLLIAGWWYWRSYELFGDPLMWDVTLAAKGEVIGRLHPFGVDDLFQFLSIHFQSYWMWFGWLNVKAPTWIYLLVGLGAVLAALGLLRLAISKHIAFNRLALGFNILAILAIYASLFQYIQTVNWTGYQGRLAITAAASIAVILALGWVSLGGFRLARLASASLVVLAVAGLPMLILPAYPRPEIYQPGIETTRTCIRYQGGLQVEAVDVASPVVPGQLLSATVHGFGLETSTEPQRLEARLLGRDGVLVGQGSTNLSWQQGDVVSAEVSFPVAAVASNARGVLEIAMVSSSGDWQAASSATGRTLESPLAVETLKIAPLRPFEAFPENVVDANFADQLALIGYDLEEQDDLVNVTLYWKTLAEMDFDYTTFVHGMTSDQKLVVQQDGQPHDGFYPTSIWDIGEIVADTKSMKLPAGTSMQDIRLAVGVYRLETLARLTVNSTDQGEAIDDQLYLP